MFPEAAPNPVGSSSPVGSGGIAGPPNPVQPADSPGRAAVTFLLCAVLFTATLSLVSMVVGIVGASRPATHGLLLSMLLNVVVLTLGLLAIARVRVPELRAMSAIGLVRRPSAGREAGLGAAAGWAIGVALVVPGLLGLRLHSAISTDAFHLGATAESIFVLMLFVVGRQLVFCGLPFRSLSRATSPTFASVAFAGVAALLTLVTARGDAGAALFTAAAQLVFCMAAARTRAVWLGGALQLAWGLTTTVLFGLPSFLWPPATGAVQGSLQGPRWVTGGRMGPEAALWAGLVVIGALVAVWRLTRDYAWHYTFDPIVGAGYAMDVPPPAEHVRMEQVAQAPTLVQIGAIPSGSAQPAVQRDEPPPKL